MLIPREFPRNSQETGRFSNIGGNMLPKVFPGICRKMFINIQLKKIFFEIINFNGLNDRSHWDAFNTYFCIGICQLKSIQRSNFRNCFVPRWKWKLGTFREFPCFLNIGELPGQIGEPCSPGILHILREIPDLDAGWSTLLCNMIHCQNIVDFDYPRLSSKIDVSNLGTRWS